MNVEKELELSQILLFCVGALTNFDETVTKIDKYKIKKKSCINDIFFKFHDGNFEWAGTLLMGDK